MKRTIMPKYILLGLTMLLCAGCGTKTPDESSTAPESVTVIEHTETVTESESETDSRPETESTTEPETEEVTEPAETTETAPLPSEITEPELPEKPEQPKTEPAAEQLPLTVPEIEEALQAMGYSMSIVNELDDHTVAAAVYENTILSYIIQIDPVSGIGEVGNAFEEPLGTIDLRNRMVLSGSPLPAPEVEFVPAPATLSEPLTEEYVLEQLKKQYILSENPGVGEYYDYPAVEEDTFTYYDWMMGVSGVGHTITVFRYSGQVVVRDEHGRYETDFMLQLP